MKRVSSPVARSLIHTSQLPSESGAKRRSLAKAIFVPSGDQSGAMSRAFAFVNRSSSPVASVRIQMSERPRPRPWMLWNAIRFPSGAHAGAKLACRFRS